MSEESIHVAGALESIGAFGGAMPFSLEEHQAFLKDAYAAMNGIFCRDNDCEDSDCHRCYPDEDCYSLTHPKCGGSDKDSENSDSADSEE